MANCFKPGGCGCRMAAMAETERLRNFNRPGPIDPTDRACRRCCRCCRRCSGQGPCLDYPTCCECFCPNPISPIYRGPCAPAPGSDCTRRWAPVTDAADIDEDWDWDRCRWPRDRRFQADEELETDEELEEDEEDEEEDEEEVADEVRYPRCRRRYDVEDALRYYGMRN